jgi:hypothetical protein
VYICKLGFLRGNKGSTAILNAFSITFGIRLASKGQLISKQGFVFISINQGLNL